MKKILFSLVAMGLMSVSSFADTGKIGAINFASNGAVWVDLVIAENNIKTKKIAASGDIKKSLIAAILTAKSTNSDVTMWPGTIDGITGWKNVIIK